MQDEKTAIYSNIRKDVEKSFDSSFLDVTSEVINVYTIMSISNSSSFDFIIVNNEQYVGLCFLKSVAWSCNGAVARSCNGAASATCILSSSKKTVYKCQKLPHYNSRQYTSGRSCPITTQYSIQVAEAAPLQLKTVYKWQKLPHYNSVQRI